eukprot:6086867-Amphidinium_carterae.1
MSGRELGYYPGTACEDQTTTLLRAWTSTQPETTTKLRGETPSHRRCGRYGLGGSSTWLRTNVCGTPGSRRIPLGQCVICSHWA